MNRKWAAITCKSAARIRNGSKNGVEISSVLRLSIEGIREGRLLCFTYFVKGVPHR